MKPYLVDVPVLLFVFVRPDTLAVVFEEVKKARPSMLFLASDGPRTHKPGDKERIRKSREIVEQVDWDCKVYKLYFDTNQGLYQMVQKALDFTFYYTDRCIFLEDDVVPSQSFFPFCAQLLEKYKDDLRINLICGMNHLGEYPEPTADYFFTDAAAIWGFALWKRTYMEFYDSCYGRSTYIMKMLRDKTRNRKGFYTNLKEYYEKHTVNGHPGGPEFFIRLTGCSQNRVNILPARNLIKNIGYGEGATHSAGDLKLLPSRVQKIFDMKVYELEFPLKHPQYVISDSRFERKQNLVTANNHPLRAVSRRAEGCLRRFYYKDKSGLKEDVTVFFGSVFCRIITFMQTGMELGSFILHKSTKLPDFIKILSLKLKQ